MALHFGEPRTPAELARPAPKHVDLLELRLPPTRVPKLSTLVAARKRLPGVRHFSVVTSDPALLDESESALAAAATAALSLEARFVVLEAPAALRPSTANEQRVLRALGYLQEALREQATEVVFEPSGLWQKGRVKALCRELRAGFVQRPEDVEPAPNLYLRLLQLGTGRTRFARQLDDVARAIADSPEAWVVVVGGAPAGLARSLVEAVASFTDEGDDEGAL